MAVSALTLACPAKVNLALAVDKPNPADSRGMHPIASWMVAVDFGDQLTVTINESTDAVSPTSVFSLLFADNAPSPQKIDWPLESDLVFRAHGLVEQHVGRQLLVEVDLKKYIPTGAGLGGGSSNAAGMILALDQLFELNLSRTAFATFAAELGSDVHFAIAAMQGRPSALVTGSGNELEDFELVDPLDLVLVLPPFGCPTGPVYAAWDRLASNNDRSFREQAVRVLTRQRLGPDTGFVNDLEAAAVAVEPRLGELLKTLRDQLGLPAYVTGSGAACFIPTADRDSAEEVASRVTSQTGLPAVKTKTLGGVASTP